LVLWILITILSKSGIGSYRYYTFLAIPVFGYFLYYVAQINVNISTKRNKVIQYANGIAYEFFMAQFFTWKLSAIVIKLIPVLNNNLGRVLVSFAICTIIAAVMHELITKPCKKIKLHSKPMNI
jgi:peptidoglycan/LPS O-acetylase OafA/YrhL